jgi:hypothetical protein
LYGYETRCFALREELRLRVFDDTVLKKIFRPKRDEVKGEWRKAHNKELCEIYSPPSINWVTKLRRMKWVGNAARMGDRGD